VERKVLVTIANALWGQDGHAFEADFLDALAENYGAGMRIVDFVGATEAARGVINEWVADETNDRITDLIPEGALGPMVRMVLTNAVYLDATWRVPFDPEATADGPFTLLDGPQVTVPIMHQEESLPYASGEGWQAVELPYVGGELAMTILVPDAGRYGEIEADAGALLDAVRGSEVRMVRLGLPSFEFRTQTGLGDVLRRLGMPGAFDPATADFSGMTAAERLFISDVIHEAFIAVDEAGTEAAAATAVVMRATGAPMDAVTLEIDRPFLFSLYDRETGAVLFMGRVLDPSHS
jgi:serpin B